MPRDTQRKKTPTMLAAEAAASATSALEQSASALSEIARHEKECSARWAEAHAELKALSKSVSSHAARWEKVAFMVIGTVVCGVLATFVKGWL